MGTEKDKKLAFLDTAVSREPDGRLTTSIYGKPLRARQTSRNKTLRHLRGEKHLSCVLFSNGYPFSFLQKLTKIGKPNDSAEPANEFKATAVILKGQRSIREASLLPTITRRTRCFQVGDYAKISVSTTKRRCRPG